MKLFVLLTDAFGGRGGIAKFNRDLLRALSSYPEMEEIAVMPRVKPVESIDGIPDSVDYHAEAAGNKFRYAWTVLRSTFNVQCSTFDGVICGHIHLLPLAWMAARREGVPLLLIVHGLEARNPSQKWLANKLVPHVDAFVSVSEFTKERLVQWSGVHPEKGHIVPNCIDRSQFGPGERPTYLQERYGLGERTVIMTLSRLPAQETGKGHDEVLEVLPALVQEIPDLTYLICGDGPDRPRLEEKARTLGVDDRVVFAGYVPEEEKVDHYRVADAFVMPGRTEGFGIVYLEALACGIPVVASSADASQEAVRDGKLGTVVDPDDANSVKRGILKALDTTRAVPDGIDYFSSGRFRERWHRVLRTCFHPQAPLVANASG